MAKPSAQLDVPSPHLGTGLQVGWLGDVRMVHEALTAELLRLPNFLLESDFA